MVRVKTGDWAELGGHAGRIRTNVFLEEQRIPADMEWDDADRVAIHAVAYNGLDQPVATGRLLQQSPGVARIGRMAVHRALRGGGVGRQVLNALVAAAAARGDREVTLNAQRSAEDFYRRLGFVPRGAAFEEAGIAHIEMVRAVAPA